MNLIINFIFGLGITIIVYIGTRYLYLKYKNPFLIPILPSATIIGALLLIFDIPFESYMVGAKWLDWFMGPAVVSLAYPLYNQFNILKKHAAPILLGVFVGAFTGVVSGALFLKWTGFDDSLIFAIMPKNATTPIALAVSDTLGGLNSLVPLFVSCAALGGAVLGPTIMKWFKIDTNLGQGVGMGTASHAVGTAKIIEISEEAGAISTVSMVLSAVMITIISLVVSYLFF
ncbi:LrgB family protein [Bacillaceae bacterium S4-13-58]